MKLSRPAIYIIGMMIIIMAFTYLTAQLEGSLKLIVIGDTVLFASEIIGWLLISKGEAGK